MIRFEKKEETFVRWVRILLRSLPMTFYLIVLPYLLVYRVFPYANNGDILTYTVLYLVGIIVLQILGSVRAYYSWKTRDVKPPKAPPMYYTEEQKKSWWCCSGTSQEIPPQKKTSIPTSPNAFNFYAPAHLMELSSLALEFIQMATFPMQNNPYDNNVPTAMPTPAPSFTQPNQATVDKFWGTRIFEAVYIHLPSNLNFTLVAMWGAVALVCLLILIFSLQFLSELRIYGYLMKDLDKKDKAKDSFFYSFTGAIVYGHGKPNNITDNMRMVVAVLSDGLFLIISLQLLNVFACDYSYEDGISTLRADSTVTCWEGNHAILAVCAFISYAFYVPLSIMITPMLLEAPQKDENSTENGPCEITYLKLYLMTINVVKGIMLLVTAPRATRTIWGHQGPRGQYLG